MFITVKSGYHKCVVLSNDTDVTIGLVYNMTFVTEVGLKELWVQARVGDNTHFIPLHSIHKKFGLQVVNVLPAVHSLTGCDMTSKVGTTAMKANHEHYLEDFGKTTGLTPSIIHDAESFLVQVVCKTSQVKTFTDLRHEMFHFN